MPAPRSTLVLLGFMVVSACKDAPPPPRLHAEDHRRGLAMLANRDATHGPQTFVIEPNRAHLHDLIQGGLTTRNTGLVLCVAATQILGRDIIGIVKVENGGAADIAVYAAIPGGQPVLDDKLTQCFREELGARPFPGVDRDALGDYPHALATFRALGVREDR